MSNNVFTIRIRGQNWKIRLLSFDMFIKTYGTAQSAITFPIERLIVFNDEDIKLSYTIHELTHAYFRASHTISANLSTHQVEEVMCEMIGEFGPEIIKMSRKITKHLKTLSSEL